jgi:hypothetical protein
VPASSRRRSTRPSSRHVSPASFRSRSAKMTPRSLGGNASRRCQGGMTGAAADAGRSLVGRTVLRSTLRNVVEAIGGELQLARRRWARW